MRPSEQRRASVGRERGELGGRAQDDAVDLLHHVEGSVVHGVVGAERERARHGHVGAGERGEHGVLACHVVRGREHVAERRPAQHPLVGPVADRVREVRAAARDQRRVQRRAGRAFDVRGEPRPQAIEIDTGRSLRHGRETTDCESRRVLRAACVAGLHGLAVAAGVAGDAADGHVDPEAGGGALFLRLAAPEAVLAVLAGPVAAVDERRARRGTRRGPAPRGWPGPRGARRRARRRVATRRGTLPRRPTAAVR